MRRTTWFLVFAVMLSVAVLGCRKPMGTMPVEVQVTLSDYKIESSLSTFSQGVSYRFLVTNKGSVPHELMVVAPMIAGMSMHETHKQALGIVDEKDLAPGATKTMTLTFTKAFQQGQLEFACHLPGHYEKGMMLPIVATGGSEGGD